MDIDKLIDIVVKAIDFKVKINIGAVGGIIMLISSIKFWDTKITKKKRIPDDWYFITVLILGLIAGVMVIPGVISIRTVFIYSIAHSGAASFFYLFGKKILLGKGNFTGNKDQRGEQ